MKVYLRKLIIQMTPDEFMMLDAAASNISQTTVIYATIAVSVIPILMVYPFIQKFFVKGIMVGSIKG